MTLTIKAENKTMNTSEKYENVDSNLVTIKETNKRNGTKVIQARIENGKRHIVVSSGNYTKITVQEEETGRFLLKYER